MKAKKNWIFLGAALASAVIIGGGAGKIAGEASANQRNHGIEEQTEGETELEAEQEIRDRFMKGGSQR